MEGNGSNGEAWRDTSPRPRARALSLSQAVSLPLYFSPSRGRRSIQNKFFKKKSKNYSTEYSHVVPHHSTDSAIDCLTTQIGRDAVLLVVYGRNSLFRGNRTMIYRPTVET
jgi:hypothetical protein